MRFDGIKEDEILQESSENECGDFIYDLDDEDGWDEPEDEEVQELTEPIDEKLSEAEEDDNWDDLDDGDLEVDNQSDLSQNQDKMDPEVEQEPYAEVKEISQADVLDVKETTEENVDWKQQKEFVDTGNYDERNRKLSINSIEGQEEQQDVENVYFSTYKERLDKTPGMNGERGEWSGERGESEFAPNNQEIKDVLSNYDKLDISYREAIPNFFEVSEVTVKIDDMSENRANNFKQCDEKCAEQWSSVSYNEKSDWSPRDVKAWRQENNYSWHERNDMKTCDLVPTQVNSYFGHLGGVSECKKRNAIKGGNEFDE